MLLCIFDPCCLTYVNIDASDVRLGGPLTQDQKGKEVTIMCISHTLTDTERCYSAMEKEALACLWAVERFEKFLHGHHFMLLTDHSSLQQILSSPSKAEGIRKMGKYVHWAERLSAYNLDIVHRPGEQNSVPDMLSPLPLSTTGPAVDDFDVLCLFQQIQSHSISFSEIKKHTQSDPLLLTVLHFVDTHWLHKDQIPNSLHPFYSVQGELEILEGILLHEGHIVVPQALQPKLLHMAHAGHPGMVRMKCHLRETYWWPGLDMQVEQLVRCCELCQWISKSQPPDPIPLQSIPKHSAPWKCLGIDLAGPLATAPMHHLFIVSVVDYYSSYPEVLLTTNTCSSTLIHWL